MWRAASLLLCAYSASALLEVHVCCGCGDDNATGTSRQDALNSVYAAKQLLRSLRAAQVTVGPSTVWVQGTCYVDETLKFAAEDGGADETSRVTWRGYDDAPVPAITGAVPVPALSPVSDPWILSQLPPAAAGNVQQVDLAALGVDVGTPYCRAYCGGDASILPGNLMPSLAELLFPDPNNAGHYLPLTLARYPNRDVPPTQWSHVKNVSNWNARQFAVDDTTAARLASWAPQFAAATFGSISSHMVNPLGWADWFSFVAALEPSNATLELAVCGTDYETIEAGAYFYVTNLLAELDQPGEYVINASARMMYVWPPTPAYFQMSEHGMPVVANMTAAGSLTSGRPTALAVADAPVAMVSAVGDLLDLTGTSFLSFSGIAFFGARGAGLALVGTSNVTLDSCVVESVGIMGVNATGGSGFTLSSSTVRYAGNGGVLLYAGNRTDLTPAGHTILSSSVHYSNRYMFCYTPLVALADCGNKLVNSEVYGGPHQGVFSSGNEHSALGNTLHDIVQVTHDSGAFYMGKLLLLLFRRHCCFSIQASLRILAAVRRHFTRVSSTGRRVSPSVAGRDTTYRGNVIANNLFTRINTIFSGNDVSAVYLDDSGAGFLIVNNTFMNVSRALLLGGGRDNIFDSNYVQGADGTDAAIHFDDRDLGWAASACQISPPGILVQFLNRVPYNTSQAWISKYPTLPNILNDQLCVPKYNRITNNRICGSTAGLPWIDATDAQVISWNSTLANNTNTTSC